MPLLCCVPVVHIRVSAPPTNPYAAPPPAVARYRMHTSLWQFQQHRQELEGQQLLVKARRQ